MKLKCKIKGPVEVPGVGSGFYFNDEIDVPPHIGNSLARSAHWSEIKEEKKKSVVIEKKPEKAEVKNADTSKSS